MLRSGVTSITRPVRVHGLIHSPARHNSSLAWVQELVDKSEGKGYRVVDAGMKSHRVAWGDHDSFNHVNNVVYLKWLETARFHFLMDIFKQRGLEFNDFMSVKGVGVVFRSAEIQWRWPIQFPDKITVMHKVEPLTHPDRFMLKGIVFSHNARKVACRIHETLVTVDHPKGGIKTDIPPKFKAVFEEWSQKGANGET